MDILEISILGKESMTEKIFHIFLFGKYYDYHRRDIAADEVDYLNVDDPDFFSHRAWGT